MRLIIIETKLAELKYRLLEIPRALILWATLSPAWKRWQTAKLIAHNQSVRDYWREVGVDPRVAELAVTQELQFQEVGEDYNDKS